MEIVRDIDLPAPADEVWEALTDPDQLERWYANDVELDPRPGGTAVFRWDNGEERRGTVESIEAGDHVRLRWDDAGIVELRIEELDVGTRVHVRETSPEWSTALEISALAACATR
jgi:uncharacterized protein YndB with AHSA1/START domain